VVNSLSVFEATVDTGAAGPSKEWQSRNIDIGWPRDDPQPRPRTHDDVRCRGRSRDYQAVLDELAANRGATTLTLRRRPGRQGLCPHRPPIDAAISTNWFAAELKNRRLPRISARLRRTADFRRCATGENPHQTGGVLFARPNKTPRRRHQRRQLQGKRAGRTTNIKRHTDAAYECLAEFRRRRATAAWRHRQACKSFVEWPKAPISSTPTARRLACDFNPRPFGGIVALNTGPLDWRTPRLRAHHP